MIVKGNKYVIEIDGRLVENGFECSTVSEQPRTLYSVRGLKNVVLGEDEINGLEPYRDSEQIEKIKDEIIECATHLKNMLESIIPDGGKLK